MKWIGAAHATEVAVEYPVSDTTHLAEPYSLTFNYPDGSTKTVEVSARIAALLIQDQEMQRDAESTSRS